MQRLRKRLRKVLALGARNPSLRCNPLQATWRSDEQTNLRDDTIWPTYGLWSTIQSITTEIRQDLRSTKPLIPCRLERAWGKLPAPDTLILSLSLVGAIPNLSVTPALHGHPNAPQSAHGAEGPVAVT